MHSAKLRGHDGAVALKIRTHRMQHIQDPRYVGDQRDIDRFDLRKRRKSTVGDEKAIGVANPAQKMIDGRIQ